MEQVGMLGLWPRRWRWQVLLPARRVRPPTRCFGSLRLHAIVIVPRPRGMIVRCLRGCLWLTQLGDCKDVIVEAGGLHVVDREAELAIQALEDSQVQIERASP
jgi:hypothetical protein